VHLQDQLCTLHLQTCSHLKLTISQLKEKFEVYLFVKKYSGIGWDNEDPHVTAMEEVIKTFLEVRLHPPYATCFSVHGSCTLYTAPAPCFTYSLLLPVYHPSC
jgi:hypothetical protein